MATSTEICMQVDLLAIAYGRKLDDDGRVYEAYELGLADVDSDHLRRGVTAVIREQLQFMPTPAQVRAFAFKCRDEERRVDQAKDDDRRIKCLVCMDSGALLVVHPKWISEHHGEINDAFFVAGWMREAFIWCRKNGYRDLLVYVACNCECHKAQVYQRQIVAAREPESKRLSAFPEVYDPDRRCIVDSPQAADVAIALLDWVNEVTAARPWSGNWNP